MFNFQIYALRVELEGFLGEKISSMRLPYSLPVNTVRHVITFGTQQQKNWLSGEGPVKLIKRVKCFYSLYQISSVLSF